MRPPPTRLWSLLGPAREGGTCIAGHTSSGDVLGGPAGAVRVYGPYRQPPLVNVPRRAGLDSGRYGGFDRDAAGEPPAPVLVASGLIASSSLDARLK